MSNEQMRAEFEEWHRGKFSTKHCTGQPTRDMHNGVYDEKYGPLHQQQMWAAWQAARAQPAGEAVADEVEREWNETWRDIVAPNGTIDISQLKKELADYSMLLDAAPKVYMHVTGGKISKPNTLPEIVCSVADDYTTELFQEQRDTAQPAGEAVASTLSRDHIREIFMAHGFTVLLSTAPPSQVPDTTMLDAARYRWLCETSDCPISAVDGDGEVLVGTTLDSAIDAAMLSTPQPKGGKE
ncbi:hypothetical protein [Aquitalea aquatilis]|uniref:hypothetical protein n=1 Tax=Aquitalea aquatilis TaxID=1537400 RepID=UPI0010BDF0BB|nr:hypothetical protein [Aquitalea aquatilis]